MGENESTRRTSRHDLSSNMSVSSGSLVAMATEEMTFNNQQTTTTKGRLARRAATMDLQSLVPMSPIVNGSNSSNLAVIQTGSKPKLCDMNDREQHLIDAGHQNNKVLSEDISTLRENLRNSRDSLHKRNTGKPLTIEQASRGRSQSLGNIDPLHLQAVINSSNLKHHLDTSESKDSLSESYDDVRKPQSPVLKSPDLAVRCRVFYFSHQKSLESVKQTVRRSKHCRAREKMEGKTCSGLDMAMDKLFSEMADLMDQDLSLMSQLLKLNDKIEEIKSRVTHRDEGLSQSSSWSANEVSDSEFSDADDSRIDFYNASTGALTTKSLASLNRTSNSDTSLEERVEKRRISLEERDVIVYKKKARKGRRRLQSFSRHEKSEAKHEKSVTGDSEADETDDATISDTESTLSGDSDCAIDNGNDSDNEDADDIENENPVNQPIEPPKPRKGGISRNTVFAKFHENNGTRKVDVLSSVMTMQGHNIPLDRYYVPQGLVYLKHAQGDNVFCQFTH